jgi:hypothetical protein
MARLTVLATLGPSSFERIFDTLRLWILASLHHQSLLANKKLTQGFGS